MDTERSMGLVEGFEPNLNSSDIVKDGSREQDYAQSYQMLLEMIDRSLDDYKEDLKQVLFPVFAVLYLTMVRR